MRVLQRILLFPAPRSPLLSASLSLPFTPISPPVSPSAYPHLLSTVNALELRGFLQDSQSSAVLTCSALRIRCYLTRSFIARSGVYVYA